MLPTMFLPKCVKWEKDGGYNKGINTIVPQMSIMEEEMSVPQDLCPRDRRSWWTCRCSIPWRGEWTICVGYTIGEGGE